MIRLSERSSADASDPTGCDVAPTGIATVMRRALGADAAVVAEFSPDGSRRVVRVDGVSESEADAIMVRLIRPQRSPAGEMFGPPGFSRMMYEQAGDVGVDAATVCVLQRRASGFPNADLLPAFARQAALSAGLRRPASQPDPADQIGRRTEARGIETILGLCDPDQLGYEEFNRLLAAFPDGVPIARVPLAHAAEATTRFLAPRNCPTDLA